MRVPRKRSGRVRIRSTDPGVRNPGNVVLDLWWDAETVAAMQTKYGKKAIPAAACPTPQFKVQVLMGDSVVPTSVRNVKRLGPVKCIDAQETFFHNHAEALFKCDPDWIILETQDGLGSRLIAKVTAAMYVHALHAKALYPGFCTETRVRFVPATWKTEQLNLPKGRKFYEKRKKASVAETQRILKERGLHRVATRVAAHVAVRDMSDAFMQALRTFTHLFPPNKWDASRHARGPRRPRAARQRSRRQASKRPRPPSPAPKLPQRAIMLVSSDEEEEVETSAAALHPLPWAPPEMVTLVNQGLQQFTPQLNAIRLALAQ